MTGGTCLCGDVAFTLGGELSRMSHCHCSMCRKIHGSAFATYLNADELKWTKGEHVAVAYESSPGFVRSFCGHCGSVLPHRSSRHDRWIVPAGLLDDDPGIRPEKHIFAESKAPWYELSGSLAQVTAYGEGDSSAIVDRTAHAEAAKADAAPDCNSGGCVCGKVAFRFRGNAELMMYCHCSRCRKVKGAAHATNCFVKPENFDWIRGEDNLTVFDLPGAKRFGNSFCKDCGSSVPRKSETSPAFNIPVGCLDSGPGVSPKGHIFVASKSPWYDITDHLPQFDEMPPS